MTASAGFGRCALTEGGRTGGRAGGRSRQLPGHSVTISLRNDNVAAHGSFARAVLQPLDEER